MPDPLVALVEALSFAAQRHRYQARKDQLKTPIVNHLVDVVEVLVAHGVRDNATLQTAALHDVVEDTSTTLEEIEARFGPEVRSLVAEVSDDKTLPREARKQLQVDHAAGTSPKAALVKLADKIANARDVGQRPAADWSVERRLDYLRWAALVVDRLPPVSPELLRLFRAVHREGVDLVNRFGKALVESGEDLPPTGRTPG